MRIPVGVKDDDSVGHLQVQTQTPGPGAEEEEVVGRVWGSEHLQQLLPLVCLCPSVQTKVGQV